MPWSGSVIVIRVPQRLEAGSRGGIPNPNDIDPPADGQETAVGAPRHPVQDPAKAVKHLLQPLFSHIPDGHQRIRADRGEPGAIRAPGEIVERGRVALQDAHTLTTLCLPHTQGVIQASAEQVTAIGGEGNVHNRAVMPVHYGTGAGLLDIPKPDGLVITAACQEVPIRTPGEA